jgi:uncharacterized protein YjlB
VTGSAPETLSLKPDGAIPNSALPVLIYHRLELAGDPASAEAGFADNGWWGSWRDGIYPFHHFHSIAHEVLAIVAGRASVALGGPHGETIAVERGDVLVLPAGTGHCNQGASDDLLVVGAYPEGMEWDLRRGEPDELDQVVANVAAVPLPGSDPVHGPGGPLTELWHPDS